MLEAKELVKGVYNEWDPCRMKSPFQRIYVIIVLGGYTT